MVDAQPASSSAAAGADEAAAAAAGPAAAGTAGTKDPRTVMEAVLVKMMAIYEQLANSTVLLATPQVRRQLWQHLGDAGCYCYVHWQSIAVAISASSHQWVGYGNSLPV
jgi:hypothetical protein